MLNTASVAFSREHGYDDVATTVMNREAYEQTVPWWCWQCFGFLVLPCEPLPCYSHATATPRCVRRFGCPVHPHLAHHHHHHHHHHEAFMAKVLVMYYQHHTLLGERTGARSMEHAAGTVSASRGVWYLYRVWPLPSSCMPRVPGL